MTKVKKFLGMVMAALMCFALTPTAAFAADGDQEAGKGTITISNAIPGETYTIYRILELESYNAEAKAYSYKADAAWVDFFKGPKQVALGIQVNEQNYVTWDNAKELPADDIKSFAERALQWAKEHSNVIKSAGQATAVANEAGEAQPVVFSGLDLGYYLLDSSMGTICSLDTTNPSVSIKEKNDKPTIEKFIDEDDSKGLKENDASIGDAVNFRSVITCEPGTDTYVFTDTMSKGLTLVPESIEVSPANAVKSTDYSVEDGTIKITFDDTIVAQLAGNRDDSDRNNEIVITYKALLNENAIINGPNPNDVTLEYKTDPDNTRKDTDRTETFSWGISVYKFNGNNNQPLSDAQFVLYNAIKADEDGSLVKGDAVKLTGVYPNYTVNTSEGSDKVVITTGDPSRFKIDGLDSGDYFLEEVAAPAGFNKLAGMIAVNIAEDGTVTFKMGDKTVNSDTFIYGGTDYTEVQVENKTGLELPSTGGIGTMILYVVGGLLVLGAIVVLVRRRSSAK